MKYTFLMIFLILSSVVFSQKLAPLDHKGMQSSYTSKCSGCRGGFYQVKKQFQVDSILVNVRNYCSEDRVFFVKMRFKNEQEWTDPFIYKTKSRGTFKVICPDGKIDALMITSGQSDMCQEFIDKNDWRIFMLDMIPNDLSD